MKVLLVHGWHPIEGGAEDYFRMLRQGLLEAGDEVRMLVSSAGSAAGGSADYVAYGTARLSSQVLLQVANPWAIATLRRALRGFLPDVAFVGVFADFLSPAIFEPLRNVPTVLAVVDYKVVCPNSRKLLADGTLCTARHGTVCFTGGCTSLLHWLRDRPRYAWIGRALAGVEGIVTCGRHIQRVLAADGIEAQHLDWPVRRVPGAFARSPAARPSFLYVGRLAREKGVRILVQAFSRLLRNGSQARLRMAGEGPDEDALRRLVDEAGLGDHVSFLGWMHPDALEREYETAWALVAPSIWAEPLGVSALEAIVRGVPVVASDAGGFAETVRPGLSGLLVPSGNVDALASAMADVAAGVVFPDHAVSEAERTAMERRHDLGRHVSELRRHLRDATGSRAAGRPV